MGFGKRMSEHFDRNDDNNYLELDIEEVGMEEMVLGMVANIDGKFWKIIRIDRKAGRVRFMATEGGYGHDFN